MTQLANDLVEAGLKDSPAWQKAQDQLREGRGPTTTTSTKPSNHGNQSHVTRAQL
jgi:hypothetical protein